MQSKSYEESPLLDKVINTAATLARAEFGGESITRQAEAAALTSKKYAGWIWQIIRLEEQRWRKASLIF